MARYIISGSYTGAAMKGMMAKPSNRQEAVRPLIDAAGGKIESFYLTTGESDFQMVVKMNDGASVQGLIAGLLVAGASGAVSNLKTVQAFTADEFMAAQKTAAGIAANYSAPA